MKKIILTLLSILLAFSTFAQADSIKNKFNEANSLYQKNKFEEAIGLYRQIVKANYHSAELYYNLGNAYLKNKQIPQAILYYEKALKLKPNDEDIKYNLDYANLFINSDITPVPEFFIDRIFTRLTNSITSNNWAVISYVVFILSLILIALFLFSKTTRIRKITFFSAIFLIIIAVTTLFFAIENSRQFTHSQDAIVMNRSTLKSSPDEKGTDLYIINQGLKVQTFDISDKWIEVKLPNGTKGWIKQGLIEKI